MTYMRVGVKGQRHFHNLICMMHLIGMWDVRTAQEYIEESCA